MLNDVLAAGIAASAAAKETFVSNMQHLKVQMSANIHYLGRLKEIPEKLHIGSKPMPFPTAAKILALDPDENHSDETIQEAFERMASLNQLDKGGPPYILAKIQTARTVALKGL